MGGRLKPSVNVFALLDSNDPGDDLGAPAAANGPVNINKKQQPQMSVWKANKLKAEANKKPQPPAGASKAKANGKNKKPQQPAASNAQVSTAPYAGKNKKPVQTAGASKAKVAAASTHAAINEEFQHLPPAPASLVETVFGNAYPSARHLIYENRKHNGQANGAKDSMPGNAPTDGKKGGRTRTNGAAVKDAPAPVQEEPPAPVMPVLPPPPPPSLHDTAQFPSLK